MSMKKTLSYQHTIYTCFGGSATQATVNNFVPLLFVTFSTQFSIPLDQIALLASINFITQLIVDICAPKVCSKIGLRACVVLSQVFVAAGLIGLAVLPAMLPLPYLGLALSVILYACGGGLVEVFVSPIVQACPSKHKQATMGLLHSFYCWGQVFVVLASTAFFFFFHISNWFILAVLWAILPILDAICFALVPIPALTEDGSQGLKPRQLLQSKTFLLAVLAMMGAGACEMAMAQWASAFAETGLHVSKTIGDIAGPCAFAVLMGLSRVVYAKLSQQIHLNKMMTLSGGICVLGYLLAALSPWAAGGLVGCALCGLGVGIMWPGTLSLTAEKMPAGGASMFAGLALAGDIGCVCGPALVGLMSRVTGELKTGMLISIIFPITLTIAVYFITRRGALLSSD